MRKSTRARKGFKGSETLPPLPNRFGREEDEAQTAELNSALYASGGMESADHLLLARAYINEVEAAADPSVVVFRQLCLENKLLCPSAVEKWLIDREHEQMEEDETGLGYSVLRRDEVIGHDDNYEPVIQTSEEPLEIKVRSVRSPAEDATDEDDNDAVHDGFFGVYHAKVLASGVLGILLSISRELGNKYGWSEEHTSAWILTGCVPIYNSLDLDVSLGPLNTDSDTSRWSRIHLDVLPEISPATVAAFYRVARIQMLRATGTIGLAAKGPQPGIKQLDLAIFAARHNDGRTWASLMKAWNDAASGDYVYRSHRNFARDARDTHLRLMGVPLEWKGRRKKTSESKERPEDGEA